MFVYKFFMDVYFVYCVIDLPNLCTTSQEICLIVVCDSHLPSHPVVLLDCLFQHPSGPSWSCLFSFFLCVKLALDELAYYVLSFRICAIKLFEFWYYAQGNLYGCHSCCILKQIFILLKLHNTENKKHDKTHFFFLLI